MTFDQYQKSAQRTSNTVDPDDKLVNGALGLAGESGEVADLVKKFMFQGHGLNTDDLLDELGDVLWYISEVAAGMGETIETVARRNVDKLWRRYPAGFDSVRSVNREA